MKPSLAGAGLPGLRNLVGPKVRELRRTLGTQQRFVRILKEDHGLILSRSALVKLEAGNRYVLDFELAAIALALGVGVQALLPADLQRGLANLQGK